MNSYADIDGKNPGVHAEEDAINRLMPLKLKKNLEIVDLLVIRLSKTNKIQLEQNTCTKNNDIMILVTEDDSLNAYFSFVLKSYHPNNF